LINGPIPKWSKMHPGVFAKTVYSERVEQLLQCRATDVGFAVAAEEPHG